MLVISKNMIIILPIIMRNMRMNVAKYPFWFHQLQLAWSTDLFIGFMPVSINKLTLISVQFILRFFSSFKD